MHGRLKVKTTAEQEAEKKKERAVKQKKYLAGIDAVFSKRAKNIHDQEALLITAQLLGANPDAATFWNFRREVLLTFKSELDEEKWQELLNEELKATEYGLVKNPKSYGAWHHRDWVFQLIPSPDYSEELELCDRYLQKDDRNFHCWDHRRIIVNRSQRSLAQELKFTQDLIEKNFSNYSAWHYRSKLLPIIHPPAEDCPHPIAEEVFIQELEKVVTAVFTDPSDQSPWFFLRWLLGKKEDAQRLLQVGVLTMEKTPTLVLVFAKEELAVDGVSVFLNGGKASTHVLIPHHQKHIWRLPLDLSEGQNEITLKHSELNVEVSLTTEGELVASKYLILDNLSSETNLSETAMKTLIEIKDNCLQLDQLDPGNKWVLLTLVNILAMLGVPKHQEKIFGCLDQLENLDPLRRRYYQDLRSKLLMEDKLKRCSLENTKCFELKDLGLTRLVNSHHLCFMECVDLRGNAIRSLNPISYFVNCRKLLLDGNPISDLSPVSHLKNLRELSLNSCGIRSLSVLESLRNNLSLEELSLKDNEVSKQSEFESKLETLIPQLLDVKF